MEVIPYNSEKKSDWDNFIKNSKNGTFLFCRDFMEYHQDRFEDFSLMLYERQKLLAVLPANRLGGQVFSHQGLTYGGLVFSKKIKFEKVLFLFRHLLEFLEKDGIQKLQIKTLPKIYQTYLSDEIDYLLFLVQAKLTRCDLSSCIKTENRLKIQANRTQGSKKARKQGLEIRKETKFGAFWKEILIPNLEKNHAAKPVHSFEEMEKLAKVFPENIQQYNVYHSKKLVGGATLFETKNVVHVQYISANEDKQKLGTLDCLFQYLIEEKYTHKKYFDFGTSNENEGKNLNKGLLYWKECFGARAVAQKSYEINTNMYHKLDEVFI